MICFIPFHSFINECQMTSGGRLLKHQADTFASVGLDFFGTFSKISYVIKKIQNNLLFI